MPNGEFERLIRGPQVSAEEAILHQLTTVVTAMTNIAAQLVQTRMTPLNDTQTIALMAARLLPDSDADPNFVIDKEDVAGAVKLAQEMLLESQRQSPRFVAELLRTKASVDAEMKRIHEEHNRLLKEAEGG